MKKIFTLSVTFILLALVSFSQEFGGTPPNCILPDGYILSQGDRLVVYQNRLKGCADDCGIITPGVGGNNPGNLVFPAESHKATLIKSFSMFVFDANLNCSSDKPFACLTYVTLYIVPESYNSVTAPAEHEKFGESRPFLLKDHGDVNTVSVSFSKAAVQSKKYRVFLDFGKGTPCIQQNTKYIIDIVPEGSLLPVNLSSFLASRSGSEVSLSWKTEVEMNVVNFEVQRSFDNSSFSTIGTIAASSSKAYSFVDKSNSAKQVSYYRLKIVKQGEVSYSDIRTVKGLAAKAGLIIYPNPSVGNARVTLSDVSEPTRVQLLDNSGRIVKTLMLNNSNSVELNGLIKGTYMVKIIGSVTGHTEVKKLTVIN